MKKFLQKAILLTPILLIVAFINYKADPANLFSAKKYVNGMADLLSKGYNVANVSNYDERLLQKDLIDKLNYNPNIVVLGSSRSMLINSEYFKDSLFFNNSVSGAVLEDYLSIYELYFEKGIKIKEIILGLDPWILNSNNDDNRWQALTENYLDMLNILEIPFTEIKYLKARYYRWATYSQILSLNYFQSSIDFLINGEISTYYPTLKRENKFITRLKDGSISYDIEYRTRTDKVIEEYAKQYILMNPIYDLGNFTNLSTEKINVLRKFIKYLLKNKTEIIFFLAPYNPIVYDYLKQTKKYRMVLETEKYFRLLAREYNIKVMGSYDPSIYNLGISDFYEGMHCNEKAIKKIFSYK